MVDADDLETLIKEEVMADATAFVEVVNAAGTTPVNYSEQSLAHGSKLSFKNYGDTHDYITVDESAKTVTIAATKTADATETAWFYVKTADGKYAYTLGVQVNDTSASGLTVTKGNSGWW